MGYAIVLLHWDIFKEKLDLVIMGESCVGLCNVHVFLFLRTNTIHRIKSKVILTGIRENKLNVMVKLFLVIVYFLIFILS